LHHKKKTLLDNFECYLPGETVPYNLPYLKLSDFLRENVDKSYVHPRLLNFSSLSEVYIWVVSKF